MGARSSALLVRQHGPGCVPLKAELLCTDAKRALGRPPPVDEPTTSDGALTSPALLASRRRSDGMRVTASSRLTGMRPSTWTATFAVQMFRPLPPELGTPPAVGSPSP